MTYVVHTFPVAAARPQDEIALGLRAAVTDFVRAGFRRRIDGGLAAGVDKDTACQRYGLLYAKAAQSYRMCRAIPAALVQWAGRVEWLAHDEGYPVPTPGTIGTTNGETITVMPGRIVLIRLGGINLTGLAATDIPAHEIVEVRIRSVVGENGTTYFAEIVTGRDLFQRESAPVPVDLENAEG